MIASSTNKPKEIINAPKETLCKSIPKASIATNTPKITRGIQPATTIPVLSPKLKKLTANTMIIASRREPTNSSIESFTT